MHVLSSFQIICYFVLAHYIIVFIIAIFFVIPISAYSSRAVADLVAGDIDFELHASNYC